MRSKYETNVEPFIDKIVEWTRQGATEKEIAKKLDISYSTFREYIKKYPALAEAFTQACIEPDDNVEAALYKRACGYTWTEVIHDVKVLQNGEEHPIVRTRTVEVPPDPTSAMFWLTNRRKDKWKYKPDETKETESKSDNPVILLPTKEILDE